MGTLGELVAEGKVREIGCSNFDAALLEEAQEAVPAGGPRFVSVQNEYNLFHREPEDEVLAFCDRTQTAFLPYFPLASGVLSGKYRAGVPAPDGTRMAAWGAMAESALAAERLAAVAALDALAQTEGHTVLDLAFAWLLSRPSVASVIAGATRPEQVAANAAAGGWKPSAELLAQVDTIAPR
jgi:aryl-alcohol dehydrogenase-like predicted oxidoreductase